uniref:Carboxypeptidase N subunit 2 n=1 Tax=Ficedula albicollis TaxID=59894 RepID=A0A803W9F4_FICAL
MWLLATFGEGGITPVVTGWAGAQSKNPGETLGREVLPVPGCRLVIYMLLGLGSLLVGALSPSCPPTCQCYDTSKVFCSSERMREIPEGLPGSATHLFFVETELEAAAFQGLPSLTELEVSGNPLPAVSLGVLAGLTSLSKLSLTTNAIRTLQPGLFTGSCSLQDLSLSRNRIEALPPGIFHPLRQLQALDLSQNALAELPDGLLAPLVALRVLKLSDNLLARVPPGAFRALGQLTELHLDGNRLEELPSGIFSGLGGLRRLQLQHNALGSLASGLGGLRRLHLHLEGNSLATVPAILFGLAGLTELQLSHNNLSSLPLVRVGLSDNPWLCDCRLSYLLNWLQSFAEPLIHGQAFCAGPAALQGQSLLEVSRGQLQCPGAHGVPPEEGWDTDAPGQCTYSSPEGAVSVACNATSCQRLSLRLPPPGQQRGSAPAAYRGAWVLRSRCGTLQVSVLVTAQSGNETTSPAVPTVP